jgi:hypothetical protein
MPRSLDLITDQKTGNLSSEKLWFHIHSIGLFIAVQRGFPAELIVAYGSVAYGSSMFAKYISWRRNRGKPDRISEEPNPPGRG